MLTEPLLNADMPLMRLVDSLRSWGRTVALKTLTNDYAWDDLQGDIARLAGPGALDFEAYRDTPMKYYHWRYNRADELFCVFQMSHKWAKTAVSPHIHVIPLSAGAGKFAVVGQYAWMRVGEALPANAGWTAIELEEDWTAADQYTERIISFPEIPAPPGAQHSHILSIYLKRDLSRDTYTTNKSYGTPAANVALVSMDTHYQANRTGTITEFGGY
jgi:hypothetical protein